MKLYWRYKKNGKWTWTAAIINKNCRYACYCVEGMLTEEEE